MLNFRWKITKIMQCLIICLLLIPWLVFRRFFSETISAADRQIWLIKYQCLFDAEFKKLRKRSHRCILLQIIFRESAVPNLCPVAAVFLKCKTTDVQHKKAIFYNEIVIKSDELQMGSCKALVISKLHRYFDLLFCNIIWRKILFISIKLAFRLRSCVFKTIFDF